MGQVILNASNTTVNLASNFIHEPNGDTWAFLHAGSGVVTNTPDLTPSTAFESTTSLNFWSYIQRVAMIFNTTGIIPANNSITSAFIEISVAGSQEQSFSDTISLINQVPYTDYSSVNSWYDAIYSPASSNNSWAYNAPGTTGSVVGYNTTQTVDHYDFNLTGISQISLSSPTIFTLIPEADRLGVEPIWQNSKANVRTYNTNISNNGVLLVINYAPTVPTIGVLREWNGTNWVLVNMDEFNGSNYSTNNASLQVFENGKWQYIVTKNH